MNDPQSLSPSNQFDTSSDSQSPAASKPSESPPPATPKIIFTPEDMAVAQFSEHRSGIQTFTESAPSQSDE
jgi:hypothetical protein